MWEDETSTAREDLDLDEWIEADEGNFTDLDLVEIDDLQALPIPQGRL